MAEEYNGGTETLEVISEANSFNRWMFETIKPYCSGNILEIGSGIGNISSFFLKNNFDISLSDLSNEYFEILQNKFGESIHLKDIFLLDIGEKEALQKYPDLIGKFDTVFALNVVEHVPDHEQAIRNCKLFLKPGGKLVILVPAFQLLYNKFDEILEHQRRYTPRSLEALMSIPGFKIIHTQFFNVMGIVGWFVSGKLMRKKTIPEGQMRLYDKLVPVWKVLDWFMGRFFGLSVICVAQKE
jgi:SAM-dependent methyltransferase